MVLGSSIPVLGMKVKRYKSVIIFNLNHINEKVFSRALKKYG